MHKLVREKNCIREWRVVAPRVMNDALVEIAYFFFPICRKKDDASRDAGAVFDSIFGEFRGMPTANAEG